MTIIEYELANYVPKCCPNVLHFSIHSMELTDTLWHTLINQIYHHIIFTATELH